MAKKTGNNHHQKTERGNVGGVIEIVGKGQLPQEFITIGEDFEKALGRCVLRDDYQRNCVIIYKAQLEMLGLWDEIEDLTNWLNASSAVGGYNRSLAAMTYTGIYVPEGAGIKLGKDSQKALMELQKLRAQGQQQREGHQDGENQQQ